MSRKRGGCWDLSDLPGSTPIKGANWARAASEDSGWPCLAVVSPEHGQRNMMEVSCALRMWASTRHWSQLRQLAAGKTRTEVLVSCWGAFLASIWSRTQGDKCLSHFYSQDRAH